MTVTVVVSRARDKDEADDWCRLDRDDAGQGRDPIPVSFIQHILGSMIYSHR